MRFRYTILYVADVAASLSFYQQAFGFTLKMLHESGDYGELQTGDTLLAFSSLSLMRQLGKHPGSADPKQPIFELAFETEDVELALKQALVAGASLVKQPETMPWGQVIAYVSDPNGFLIEICSPV
ncbi:VOC family protein [uncultured Thiothrix sp.]|uniref:VOC family protein n=1 Tax=uncultured Thiothrix sp. TaxID=223185 RepID=UPI0026024C9D|nr:VOC family protein [uncultured Thiothrix sp.]